MAATRPRPAGRSSRPAHRRLQHFAGVAGVGDRPLAPRWAGRRCTDGASRRCGEAAGREQDTLARLRRSSSTVSGDSGADDPTVLDDEVVHRGVFVQTAGTLAGHVDQRLEDLTDDRRTVGQDVASPRRAALVRRNTRMATANARGERLKYCTERSSLVLTTNPRFQFLSITAGPCRSSPRAAPRHTGCPRPSARRRCRPCGSGSSRSSRGTARAERLCASRNSIISLPAVRNISRRAGDDASPMSPTTSSK